MTLNSAKTAKGTILVVDDSPDNLRALSMTLTKQGYKIRCTTDSEMALSSIDKFPPDLVLLDIRMPVMDGYEVCRRLKANPATKDIPVIFLSAADDAAGKVKAFAIGGADYITKPFQTEEVLARIVNQLTIQKLQSQLSEQNQRLQQEIDEHKRTMAALQDAKESAEVSSYVKSKFLATMSHELRTPLNSILGFTALMKSDSSLTAEQCDYLTSISYSGQHLLKLINHILMVVSAEANKLSLNETKFDLRQLVNSIAATWQQKATAKSLQLILEWEPTVPRFIRSDESKLRQVLINLLENAIQFTHAGKVVLRVKVESHLVQEQETEKGNNSPVPLSLLFEVEDTGSGVAPHETERLFEVFSQTETGQKTRRGLGLGLFVSRQFVQVMGGDITITSSPGQGTIVRFYISIPPDHSDSDLLQPSHDVMELLSIFPTQSLAPQTASVTEAWILEAIQAEMSVDWLVQLHQAAIRGFDRQIFHLIQEIPITHAPLAKVLNDWNQNFQFGWIVTITQQVLEHIS